MVIPSYEEVVKVIGFSICDYLKFLNELLPINILDLNILKIVDKSGARELSYLYDVLVNKPFWTFLLFLAELRSVIF